MGQGSQSLNTSYGRRPGLGTGMGQRGSGRNNAHGGSSGGYGTGSTYGVAPARLTPVDPPTWMNDARPMTGPPGDWAGQQMDWLNGVLQNTPGGAFSPQSELINLGFSGGLQNRPLDPGYSESPYADLIRQSAEAARLRPNPAVPAGPLGERLQAMVNDFHARGGVDGWENAGSASPAQVDQNYADWTAQTPGQALPGGPYFNPGPAGNLFGGQSALEAMGRRNQTPAGPPDPEMIATGPGEFTARDALPSSWPQTHTRSTRRPGTGPLGGVRAGRRRPGGRGRRQFAGGGIVDAYGRRLI